MAPFRYEQFSSPYANTIAQLLLHQNDPQAQAAQTIAAAQARAGEQSAQAWGGAAQGMANAFGNTVQTIQRQQEVAPKLALEQVQLENAQREQAAQKAQASLLSQQGDPVPPGAEGPQRPSMLDENGFLDPSKVGPAYAALGFGDKVPDILHTVDLQNEAMKNYDTSTKQIANSKTIMHGVSAHGTLMLMNSGMPIDQAIDQATGAPVQTGRMSAADVAKFKTTILTLPPEQQQAVLQKMKDDAARLGPTKTDKEGDITYDMFGGIQSKGGEKEKPDYTVNGVRFSGTTNQPYGPATPPQTAPKSYQKSSVLLDGKPAEVLSDPTPGGRIYDLNGVAIDNAAQRVKPIPPPSLIIHNEQKTATPMPPWALDDTRPSGPDANVMDPNIRMTPNGLHQAALNYIANGQFPPTGRGSDPIAIAQRAAVVSKVGAIAAASGLDETGLRAFYRANGQSLAQQQKMQDTVQGFMATADKNAALLQETLKKIPDTGSPLFNQPLRAFTSKVAGDPTLSQFAIYLQSVQNEYGRIITQPTLSGVLTDNARHEAEILASKDSTVPQLLASLQALQNEGTNRVQSVGEQIQRIQQRMQAGPTPAPGAATTALQAKAQQVLAGAGKASDPASVATFLRNNPGFK